MVRRRFLRSGGWISWGRPKTLLMAMHFVYVSAGVFALFFLIFSEFYYFRAGDKNQGLQPTLILDGGVNECVWEEEG